MSTYGEHHLWSYDPVIGKSRCATREEIAARTIAFHQERLERARENRELQLRQITQYKAESVRLTTEAEKDALWRKILGWNQSVAEVFCRVLPRRPDEFSIGYTDYQI